MIMNVSAAHTIHVDEAHPLNAIPRVVWARLGAAYLVLGAAAWMLEPNTGPEHWWLHGLWCLVGLAVALPTVLRMFRVPFAVVLTEHRLMFLASFSLYFLFGAAMMAIGPESQIEQALRYYSITARDAMRANAVNGLGFGLALVTSWLFRGQWLGAAAFRSGALLSRVPAKLAISVFLLAGSIAYVHVLSFDLGLHDGLVPGIVRAFGKLSLAAAFLAAAYRGRGENWLRTAGAVLALLLVLGGTLQFNKTEALVAVAAFIAGLALRFGSRWVIPIGLLIITTLFVLLGDIAASGRSAVLHEGVRTLPERWQVVRDSWEHEGGLHGMGQYGAWSRLSYTVPQVAALDFQDAGQGGDGFEMIGWIFVPRLAAAEKPEMTKTGVEFHAKITGQERSSSTGQGVFASGYYHGGWLGLFFASVICGWIVAQTSSIARAIVSTRALLLYPFCLLGLYMAFRIDGDFVADYAGTFVFVLYPILALALISTATGVGRR